MTVDEALKEFLRDHKSRGSAARTLHWYNSTVRLLLKPWLGEPVDTLTLFVVNQALGRDVKPATLANYDRALRGFCNWLHGVDLLQRNPFEKRKRPKERWQLKQVLTLDEVASLYRTAKKDVRYRYRNQALLSVMLEGGLRASEVCRLRLEDVQWDFGELQVMGKGGNASVPIGKTTMKYLRLYVQQERKGRDPHLFLFAGRPLKAVSLSHLIGRIAKRAGIDRNVGCHLLRHTFATHYLRAGGDAFSLQRLLRHTSPAMTQRYLHFMTADLRDKSARFSPLSALPHL